MSDDVPLGKRLTQWMVDSGALNELYSVYLKNVHAALSGSHHPIGAPVALPPSKSHALAFRIALRYLESHALTNSISCLHSELSGIPPAAQVKDIALRKKLDLSSDGTALHELLQWNKADRRPLVVFNIEESVSSDGSEASSEGENEEITPLMMSPRRPANVDISVPTSSSDDEGGDADEVHSDEDIGEMDENVRRVAAEVDVGDVCLDMGDAAALKFVRIEKVKDLSRPLQGMLARSLPYMPVGHKVVPIMEK